MNVKSMMNCSFKDAIKAWNEGFQDYTVDLTMNVEGFIKMMSTKRLSPEYSVLAYDEGKPVGIILNSIQPLQGIQTAYNGGTAVHPDYRNLGVGQRLMEASLSVYEKEKVSNASLEAICTNKPAIQLYKNNGYIIKDHLDTIELDKGTFKQERDLTLKLVTYEDCKENISQHFQVMPWQNKVDFIDEREIYQFSLGRQPIGYVLLSRNKDRLTLFHLQAVRKDKSDYERMLRALNHQFKEYRVVAFNTPQSYEVNEVYHKHASQKLVEQVWMERS
ncbi:GNAT family N-acetyltransferase [Halobacillus mangrovi]|uniref:GNAT family N-acetyltransferase n=1 Tax=Halobacillus mangrovi TaxID=402384 RepID=UPI003D95A695